MTTKGNLQSINDAGKSVLQKFVKGKPWDVLSVARSFGQEYRTLIYLFLCSKCLRNKEGIILRRSWMLSGF